MIDDEAFLTMDRAASMTTVQVEWKRLFTANPSDSVAGTASCFCQKTAA